MIITSTAIMTRLRALSRVSGRQSLTGAPACRALPMLVSSLAQRGPPAIFVLFSFGCSRSATVTALGDNLHHRHHHHHHPHHHHHHHHHHQHHHRPQDTIQMHPPSSTMFSTAPPSMLSSMTSRTATSSPPSASPTCSRAVISPEAIFTRSTRYAIHAYRV